MNNKRKNIVIVGAGIIGLACAVRLVHAGHKVTLIDKDKPGTGTSFGNAGHMATEQIFPLASLQTLAAVPRYLLDSKSPIKLPLGYLPNITPWLLRLAFAARPSQFHRGTEALKSLQEQALPMMQYLLSIIARSDLLETNGNLTVVEKEANIQAAHKEIQTLNRHNVPAEWLPKEVALAHAPALSSHIAGAIHYTGTGHVTSPYAVSQSLEEYARKEGVTIMQATVKVVKRTEEGVSLSFNESNCNADMVILCAGAFSKALAKQVGVQTPLETERGYHLHMTDYSPAFSMPIGSYERKILMTPLQDGLRATGFVEFGGLKAPPYEQNYDILRHHIGKLLPEYDTQNASSWMGFRPTLPDYLPAIGFDGPDKRVLHAYGHQHLGLTLSGVTAQVVEKLIAGKKPCMDLTPFNPRRFR